MGEVRTVISVFNEFLTELQVGFNGNLRILFILWKVMARLEDKREYYDIAEQKNEERANDDAYELPEIFAGDFDGEGQASGGRCEENEYQKNFYNAKQILDLREAVD